LENDAGFQAESLHTDLIQNDEWMIEELVGFDPVLRLELKAFIDKVQARKTHLHVLGHSPIAFSQIVS
jgi:hypothetical protein